jgi:VanZ family protein
MKVNENANHAAGAGARSFQISVGLLLLLIAYGSLYPFTWHLEQPQDFIWLGPIGLIDVLENALLFLPLGLLLAWHYSSRRRQWIGFAAWLLIALAVASVLQWLQKYLPRTPALSDIVFNMVGHVVGWWLGMISSYRLDRVLLRHQNLRSADRFALLMIGIWVVAELFPLVPAFAVSSVVDNVKSLWQQDAWQPRRMLLHAGMTVIGLEALAQLVRSISSGHMSRLLVGIIVLLILAGKFVVIGQSPGPAVVFGIVGGSLVWWGMDHAEGNRRLTMLLVVAAGSYLLHAIWPLQWRDLPEAMHWLPFASALSNNIESVVTSVAFECLCFGAIIWSAVRMGGLVPGLTLSTAVLAFACEWTQCYLPTRTPEITSPLLALGMGWLVAALGQTQ